METVNEVYDDFLDIFTKVTTIYIHLIKDEKGAIEPKMSQKLKKAKQTPQKYSPTFKSNFK